MAALCSPDWRPGSSYPRVRPRAPLSLLITGRAAIFVAANFLFSSALHRVVTDSIMPLVTRDTQCTKGASMAGLKQRINLRLDDDTYLAYEKVARFFNRTPTDLAREVVEAGVPTMEMLGTMIDRAKAGDKEAADSLFSAFLDAQQGQLTLARSMASADAATAAEVSHEE